MQIGNFQFVEELFRCQSDREHRTNYAQKDKYFSHVEHWYGIPSADRCEDADRQIFPTAVFVTPSGLWNQRVTGIHKRI